MRDSARWLDSGVSAGKLTYHGPCTKLASSEGNFYMGDRVIALPINSSLGAADCSGVQQTNQPEQ